MEFSENSGPRRRVNWITELNDSFFLISSYVITWISHFQGHRTDLLYISLDLFESHSIWLLLGRTVSRRRSFNPPITFLRRPWAWDAAVPCDKEPKWPVLPYYRVWEYLSLFQVQLMFFGLWSMCVKWHLVNPTVISVLCRERTVGTVYRQLPLTNQGKRPAGQGA